MPVDPGLRRLVLGTLLGAFPGPVVPGWAGDLVADGLAGHVLFAGNIADTGQLAALTRTLREARGDVLIAVDEEGGDVTRLAHATGSPYPGNAALGAVDDVELTRAVYAAIGADLAAVGITVNLAPTVDVNTADDNPIIGTRSFGADPALVAAHAAAATLGLQAGGVAGCAKHFPGHGATLTDSHLELPTVDVPLEVLRRRDLPPFAAAVSAGVRSVMTAHIRVPALTGVAPATFSPAALDDLLRRELAFTGVVVTDALEMRGAAPVAGGMGAAAVAALRAGADLLCLGARIDAALVDEVVTAVVAAVAGGALSAGRLEQAAARNAELARWTDRPRPAHRADPQLGYAAARRAVRVEGSLAGLAGPLVVELASGSTPAEAGVPWGLGAHVAGVARLDPADVSAADLAARAGSRPIVLAGRNLHRNAAARALLEQVGARRPVVVVEMGWPGRWRPPTARAFVATYGASHANGRAAAEILRLIDR